MIFLETEAGTNIGMVTYIMTQRHYPRGVSSGIHYSESLRGGASLAVGSHPPFSKEIWLPLHVLLQETVCALSALLSESCVVLILLIVSIPTIVEILRITC